MKHQEPTTVIPGAAKATDPESGWTMLRDKRGTPVWDMPSPVDWVSYVQMVGRDGHKVRTKVQFPVYRGMSASLARYIRSQSKRRYLKAQAKAQAEWQLTNKLRSINAKNQKGQDDGPTDTPSTPAATPAAGA